MKYLLIVSLVLLSVAAIWVGVGAWQAGSVQSQGVIQDDGESPGDVLVAEKEKTPRTIPRETEPQDGERSAAPNGGVPSAERAPEGPERAHLQEELERTLDTFYGESPDIERLNELIQDLAADVLVLESSVGRDPNTGLLRGLLRLDGYGVEAEFTVDGEHCSISMQQSMDDRPFAVRALSIGLRFDRGELIGGSVAVQHHHDLKDPEVMGSFTGDKRTVGWLMKTTQATGTTARPILAWRVEGKEAVTIGPDNSDEAIIRREWDWDMSRYRAWAAHLKAYVH